jgi:WD40 repeat protein
MDSVEVKSVAELVKPVDAGAHVVAAGFLRGEAVFATGSGEIVFANGNRVKAHERGGVLEAVSDGKRIVTAGDDGRLVETVADGAMQLVAEIKNKWIDHVALGPDDAVAWSSGKTAFVRTKKGERSVEVANTVGGLSFAPKGFRLAVAHYNGVSLWFPNSEAKPEFLEWKGSHLGVTWSADGNFLITAMQEPALHGWRLSDKKHMRMSGYPSRVRTMSFSHDNRWLATSGADTAILWPFATKDGPMGKDPHMFGAARREQRVSCVACNPAGPVVALGYTDGSVKIARIEDGAEIVVRGPEGGEVISLAWSPGPKGNLAFGTDEGKAGVLVL